MAQVLITDTKLNSLADAVADKTGASTPLTIQQMEDVIEALSWVTYYTGTEAPADALGGEGDLYLQLPETTNEPTEIPEEEVV